MMNSSLIELFIHQLKAPEIDLYERATLIKNHLEEKGLSERAFARKHNFPHSTIQDWLMVLNLDKAQYNKMRNEGVSKARMYRMLRNNKGHDLSKYSEVDKKLDAAIELLNRTTSAKNSSEHTPDKIRQLEKAIATFKFRHSKYIERSEFA